MDTAPEPTSAALCPNCSSSVLMSTPWNELQEGAHVPRVVLTWREKTSDSACALCDFVQREVLYPHARDEFEVLEYFKPDYFQIYTMRWFEAIDKEIDPCELQVRQQTTSSAVNELLAFSPAITNKTFWKDVRAIWPHERLPLTDVLRRMNYVFAQHDASSDCVACSAVASLWKSDSESIYRSRFSPGKLMTANTEDETLAVVQTHRLPPATAQARRFRQRSRGEFIILKVEIVLELHERWPCLRLQEYGTRSGTTLGDWSEWADLSYTIPDSDMDMAFRHDQKDAIVYLPCLGRRGCAAPMRPTLDPELVKKWIQQCNSDVKHGLCSQQSRDSYPVAMTLIDTQDMRLMEVGPGIELPYLALSYVWGQVPQPILTKAVRAEWSAKGGLTELGIPQTILDAIHLAKAVGYRYLWVDALCIVQDDQSTRHSQIAQMYDIYRHADMTIIAAGGQDCSSGLPGVSMSHKRLERHRTYEIPGLPLMKLPTSTRYSLEASCWKTRGWTFQEELCSRRALVLLPEGALFACPSALCREDLGDGLESSLGTVDDACGGLTLLSSMIASFKDASPPQKMVIYQDLVKQYMQRSLTRPDDMENAFAGVVRLLEPHLGPVYHGIPEAHFSEGIHGCWFWDATLCRREGFPSWSWTGWIYRPEQADVGIQAMAGQRTVLQFHRLGPAAQPLGWSSVQESELGDVKPAEIREHLVPDEAELQARQDALQQSDSNIPTHLIAFSTSTALLKLRATPGPAGVEETKEYRVVHPGTGKHLTSINLKTGFVAKNGTVHPFVIIAYDPRKESFHLMLIAFEDGVAERVNVTTPGRLVRAEDWLSLTPWKSTVVMG